MPSIRDPEVKALATSSQNLEIEYPDEKGEIWIGSPFNWIRTTRSSRRRGAIGEKLVSKYLVCRGFDVQRSPDSGADRVINGKRAEIKMSTLWENGSYKFQQLRDQDYDFALLLGLSPFDAHLWVLTKRMILKRWREGAKGITSQHGGGDGTDTAWLTVNPDNVPQWLRKRGGDLSTAVRLIKKITKKNP